MYFRVRFVPSVASFRNLTKNFFAVHFGLEEVFNPRLVFNLRKIDKKTLTPKYYFFFWNVSLIPFYLQDFGGYQWYILNTTINFWFFHTRSLMFDPQHLSRWYLPVRVNDFMVLSNPPDTHDSCLGLCGRNICPKSLI